MRDALPLFGRDLFDVWAITLMPQILRFGHLPNRVTCDTVPLGNFVVGRARVVSDVLSNLAPSALR